MVIDSTFFDKEIQIDSISVTLQNGQAVAVDILRLDKIHPTISGNKWFKLKYNLLQAQHLAADSIISFGGAFSNHLHALAYAGKLFNLKTIGIVRGEEVDNPTLSDCKAWGMELHFVSRTDYRKKTESQFLHSIQEKFKHSFIIPEGGDNAFGKKGCEEILSATQARVYDILCCSIGTGTTIHGLAATFNKEIWGFAPMKNAHSLQQELTTSIENLNYIDEYHFGGFGKVSNELIEYILQFQASHHIDLDRVYTGKMFFGLEKELLKNPINTDKKILVVHTGGLQGNRSCIKS